MFEDIAGKTVLVTGASSGLGEGFARLFARHKAQVVIAARRIDVLEALQGELDRDGATVVAVQMDVTQPDSITRAVESVAGGIDILVNNAGVATFGSALNVTPGDWDKTLSTNLSGAFLTAQAVARNMKAHRRGGAIVNISSISARRTSYGLVSYATSKAGLSHMTRVLALELAGSGIRVNALCPGYIETDMSGAFFESDEGKALISRIPMNKIGTVSDLEAPLLLLCSKAGGHITGIELPVDGGHMVSAM